MTTRLAVFAAISCSSLMFFAGCAAQTEEGAPIDAESDLTSSVSLPGFATKTIALNASRPADVTLTIDCHVSLNPDDPGQRFRVDASDLTDSASPDEIARSGFWQRTFSVAPGSHTLTIENQGGPAACSITTTPVAADATCKAWSAWHSANTHHTHIAVGDPSIEQDWEPFPASGNHWGSWAAWNTVYPSAIQHGFLLHDLEHGGVVLSYKCENNESEECKAEESALVDLANSAGVGRIIVTPDPTQPTTYALRAWRWAYTSDCLDTDSAKDFLLTHIRHGREDIDADPPIPFDPTGTDVPCEDLMAAPDSCL